MDPMVGSGGGGKHGHNHHHNSVVGGVPPDENSNSNVVSLLEVCFLCNRRFLYDLTLDPSTTQDDHGLKSEDVLLHMFFEDTSALEKSLLQCCTFCKTLCKSLLDAKSALSNLIDEITNLLRKSRKLSSFTGYMLSKPRVITRLFQEQSHPPSNHVSCSSYLGNLGNLSSTIQIQLDSEYNNSSNSGFTSQFMSIGNSNSVGLSESSSKFSGNEHPEVHPVSPQQKEISPSTFSFLSPSSKSILGRKVNLKQDPLENVLIRNSTTKSSPPPKTNKRTRKQQPRPTLPIAPATVVATNNIAPSKNKNTTIMVSNSSGRFVLVQEQVSNLEENARDVEVEEDHHNEHGSEQYILLDMMNVDVDESGHREQGQGQGATVLGVKSGPRYQEPTSFASASVSISSSGGEDGQKNSLDNNLNLEKAGGENSPNTTKTNKQSITKNKTGGKFACTICPKTFKCNRDLVSHIGSHNQSKPFTCDICGTSYRQKKALDIHIGIHRGESKFECNHCKKVFTQKISLLRHLPLHTGETVYQCDLCGKGFLHHSSFAHHKLTHSGKRNFNCKFCDQNFFTSSHLKRHYRTHTGEKPFQCNICSKSFNEKSNLKVHLRAVHTKIPAFQCPECIKGFDRKHKLRTHLQNEHSQTLQDEAEVMG